MHIYIHIWFAKGVNLGLPPSRRMTIEGFCKGCSNCMTRTCKICAARKIVLGKAKQKRWDIWNIHNIGNDILT